MKQSPQKTRKKIGNLPVIDSNLQTFYDNLADLIAQEILTDEYLQDADGLRAAIPQSVQRKKAGPR